MQICLFMNLLIHFLCVLIIGPGNIIIWPLPVIKITNIYLTKSYLIIYACFYVIKMLMFYIYIPCEIF